MRLFSFFLIAGLLLLLASWPWLALPGQIQAEHTPVPVVWENNKIWNAGDGMSHFFHCLEDLQANRRDKVRIVHIGDSHIQADWFSGALRMSLQQEYGNAGRGLVFPFRQANTNSPQDIRSSSNVTWSARRISSNVSQVPAGISGFGLCTFSPDFRLSLAITPNPLGLDYRFDQVSFFTDQGPASFDLWVNEGQPAPVVAPTASARRHQVQGGESLTSLSLRYGCSVADLMAWNSLADTRILVGQWLLVSQPTQPSMGLSRSAEGLTVDLSTPGIRPYFSTVRLNGPVEQVSFSGLRNGVNQTQLTLYGMVLERSDARGILYHAIGANGARVEHYLTSKIFWEQLRALEPDLIIISLGTNETVPASFRAEAFAEKIQQMVDLALEASPESSVLLTTPPDALRQRSQANPAMPGASQALMELAWRQNYSAWDFLGVMGGSGSIFSWQRQGLAQPDGIHLTKPGYELQARLLHQALVEAYGRYLTHPSR